MSAEVYFIALSESDKEDVIINKIKKLMDRAGYGIEVNREELVLIKLHFGEKGNTGYIKPSFVRKVVDKVKEKGAFPLVADTNTLYKGERSDTYRHMLMANEHGFNITTMGCPVIIADGLRGQNQVGVEINGDYFKKVFISADAVCADSILGIAHVTGHIATGLGGQIKNIAMGLASRGGKLAQHHNQTPILNPEKCNGCGICEFWCPEGAMSVEDKAEIDESLCIGCGECLAVCPEFAMDFGWGGGRTLQGRMAEYALGALKGKENKSFFMNFITYVTKNCDCLGYDDKLIPDIGIMASRDIVALDTATADMIKQRTGNDFFREIWQKVDYTVQLKHAEKLGLGTMQYDCIEV
jgi:uncharacterized Fe-S center protein